MKVLQVLPELNSGGVERGTLELATYLASRGHESLVVSGGGRLVGQLEATGTRHLTIPIGRKSPGSLILLPKLRNLLKTEQPDIIHLRSRVPAWLMWMAWRNLPDANRPHLITTVHGFYSVNRWSAIMCRGERIICVSDSIRSYVLDNYPDTPPGVLRVIPRGVDPLVYPHGYQPSEKWREAFAREFPQTAGKRLITLPGRITRLKGHEDFIRIMTTLADDPRLHGLIVGGADPRKRDYEKELRRKVAAAGLEERITFTGNRPDLREILSVSVLVLSLTRQPESFGRTTLEALSLGVPVAGYAHGGVEEQLQLLCPAGLLPPLNPALTIPVIRQLLAHPPEIPRSHPFTLARMLEHTVEVYRELVSKY